MKIDRLNLLLILIVVAGFVVIGFGVVGFIYAKSGTMTPAEGASCMQMANAMASSSRDNPGIRPLDMYEICKEGYARARFVQSAVLAFIGALVVVAAIVIKKYFIKA